LAPSPNEIRANVWSSGLNDLQSIQGTK